MTDTHSLIARLEAIIQLLESDLGAETLAYLDIGVEQLEQTLESYQSSRVLERLDLVTSELRQDYTSELQFFGITEISTKIIPGQCEQLSKLLFSLRDCLNQYKDLTVPCRNIDEERQRRSKLQAAEDNIIALRDDLLDFNSKHLEADDSTRMDVQPEVAVSLAPPAAIQPEDESVALALENAVQEEPVMPSQQAPRPPHQQREKHVEKGKVTISPLPNTQSTSLQKSLALPPKQDQKQASSSPSFTATSIGMLHDPKSFKLGVSGKRGLGRNIKGNQKARPGLPSFERKPSRPAVTYPNASSNSILDAFTGTEPKSATHIEQTKTPNTAPISLDAETSQPVSVEPKSSLHIQPAEPDTANTAPVSFDAEISQPFSIMNDAEQADRPDQFLRTGISSNEAQLWGLIEQDELSLAYWFCKNSESKGEESSLSSNLAKAAQASRWVQVGSTAFVHDLLEASQLSICSTQCADEITKAAQLIAVGTALKPSIIAPSCGMIAWLEAPNQFRHLADLVSVIRTFSTLGLPINQEDVDPLSKNSQSTPESYAETILHWLQKEAPHKKTLFWRSSAIWKRLIEKNGELWKLLWPAALNKTADARWVKEQVVLWRQRSHMLTVFESLDKGSDEIPAGARDQLFRFVDEVCEQAEQWCQSVERESATNTRGSWIREQIQDLKRQLLEPSLAAINELLSASMTAHVALKAACFHVVRSIHDVAVVLGIELPPSAVAVRPSVPNSNEAMNAALASKLLLYPELSLDDEGNPASGDLERLFDLDEQPRIADARIALQWFEKQDYRFAARLFSLPGISDPQLAVLKTECESRLETSRKTLRETKKRVLTEIERCVVDGIIAEERSEFLARTESIDFHSCLNIAGAYVELSIISNSLQQSREARLVYLQQRYDEQVEAAEQAGTAIPDQFTSAIAESFLQKDTRVIDELLSNLPSYLESGTTFQTDWQESSNSLKALESFLRYAPKISDYLKERANLKAIAADFRSNHLRTGIYPGALSSEFREEIAATLEVWTEIKKSRTVTAKFKDSLLVLLKFLGLISSPAAASATIASPGNVSNILVSVSTISETCAPIPQVGSQCGGKYDVLCQWEPPTAENIAAWSKLKRRTSTPSLVLFFGAMSVAEKISAMRSLHDSEFATLILDETLLLFLAQEEQNRLSTFFSCSIPFTRVNPYTPFKAGNVPPEVFFGRQEMASEIKRPNGTCLIYGGRQLGKSALLHHVQRDMLQPSENKYCWVEDIKPIGDPLSNFDADTIWHRLRDRFKEADLISSKVYSDEPDKIYKLLRDAMAPDDRTVLVLFDESDNFLDADASSNFQVVDKLRTLMQETNRRFKVVFAGLHNVQRFQGIPNQPLAHFGVPLCVGPLEPAAAEQLIRLPMETLGFQFSDNAAPLRILSYTNYHPGLIQLFCQELLKTLNASPENTLPFVVTAEDVERVYRNQQIRENIRERFEWTLALDTRYQAVALAMIVEQLSTNESFGHPYSAGELLPLCRSWWAQGFNEVTTDLFRGLLDEMCGLGVLVRNAQGLYRLRSPNLVRLMGREKDLEIRLLEIANRPSEIKFDADSHHALISQKDKTYSPLTNAQERLMNAARFGVVLVWGSDALDVKQVPGALLQFVSRETENCVFEIPDVAIKDEDESKKWLKSLLKLPGERILCYRHLSESDENLDSLVASSIEFCRTQRARNRWIRIIYLFGPAATWKWLQLPKSIRDKLENECESPIAIRPWNTLGITQRLIFEQKLHLPDVCNKVLESTGGWPVLLNDLMRRCASTDDPRSVALAMQAELANDTRLQQQLQSAFGLRPGTNTFTVWELIQREKEVPDDLVEPFLSSTMSKSECANALDYLERMCLIKRVGNILRCDPIAGAVFSNTLQEVL